jgi:hypothetical protein
MLRRQRRQAHQEQDLAVDATLESDLFGVEALIEAYLKDPSPGRRSELFAALEHLDLQIDASDRYEGSIDRSGAWGYGAKGSVIGETSDVPIVEEVPEGEFQAQTALIKAAKREVSTPGPGSLAQLRAANEALAACRGQAPRIQ